MLRYNLKRSLCKSNFFRSRYWWVVTFSLGWYSFLGRFQDLKSKARSGIHPSLSEGKAKEIGFNLPVRILCWIPISTDSKHRAHLIQKTWGKQCDTLLFMSSKTDSTIPSIGLPVEDSYTTLWGKTYESLKYIYDHHLNEADWFFKADDDTYVVVDNLRFFLSSYNAALPHILGSRFAHNRLLKGYLGGGAGYAMTRETVRLFIEHVYDKQFDTCISGPDGEEDSYLAMCLELLEVIFGDTRDLNGAERFLQLSLHNLYQPWKYQTTLRAYFQSKPGLDCCSNETISFHPVKDDQLLEYEYLVKHRQQSHQTL